MFDALTDKLQAVFRRLGGRGTISEKDLDEALREVRLALLEADVHFQVVRQFVGRVRERALGAQVQRSLSPAQQVIDIVHQELKELLGGGHARLELSSSPAVVMLVGLKGSGKTTTAAKLALHLRRQGQRPLLVAADPYRVAAAEQLQALGRGLGVPVLAPVDGLSPSELARRALDAGRQDGATVLVVDTFGCLRLDPEEMESLRGLREAFSPSEVLLVADAMTGQEAVRTAQAFHEALGLTGLVLTKLDGDARGGAALSVRAVTGVPIKFVGTGERPDALEPFHPDRFAGRILGMGDVLTLIEKAKEQVSRQEAEELAHRARRGEITLEDLLLQFQRVKKMGPIQQLLGMVPGFAAIKGQLPAEALDERYLKRAEAIILSMTPEERRRPEIIDGSRRRRIARGSGTSPAEVNRLLEQYWQVRRLMQAMAKAQGRQVLSRWPKS
ncbi:MAG: signal recognition particle protein [Dehalococcoidia bacterium]|nr:signal recognition particle protein [Dehalococcoidia bacterium]MDW8009076.1 signal recognition particle protein [Chloroflexota bacterium]